VTFFVPATVTTGDYTLIARLVDPAGIADGPTAELGAVAIRQRVGTFEAPEMQTVLERPIRFGTHADLIGYDVRPTADGLDVRLHWRVEQPLLPPHHIFVHLDDAAGVTLAQDDGGPQTEAGAAPTGSWLPGEYLSTEHRIDLPAELPEDVLLRVGLYNPEGNIRLPATVDGAPGGDAAELALP
jgi:hypothetical protein